MRKTKKLALLLLAAGITAIGVGSATHTGPFAGGPHFNKQAGSGGHYNSNKQAKGAGPSAHVF